MRIVRMLIVLLVATPLAGQSAPMELTRATARVVVDGVMSDAAWSEAPPLPLTMYVPVFGGQPTQRTELRAVYDDEALYIGGWCYDTDPKGIRINSLYRDRWNGDDTIAIYVDAFNDNQNAKWFGITPAAMRFDLLVSDDGNTTNDNWDGVWSGEATITAEGWFVEVRIPFSTLGFQLGADGRAVMGLTITRLVSRIEERVTFPAIDPKFPFRRPSMAQDVVVRNVKTDKPLYVTPYLLGGTQSTASTDTDFDEEAGVDVRYPLTSRLTLDLTANTDFAQVEADEQQVALDRFPLFYPERRRFFQEGAGLFDFVTANGARLFHSRRIGLSSQGHPVPILGGVRLVGRMGAWDVGVLDMQTDDEVRGGENFGVVRLRRPVLNASSTAGVMLTSYFADGRRNLGLGADASLRMFGDEYLTLKFAATEDEAESDDLDVVDRSLFDARWERRTGRGLSYSWQFSRAGREYRPEIGFLPRRDYTVGNFVTNWYFFTDGHRYFRRVYPGALALTTFRNADRELESGQYAVWVQWDAKGGGGGWIEPKWFRESVVTPFTIGGAVHIPAGTYDFADLQLVYTMPAGSKLRTDVDFRAGTYFDGRRVQLIASPTWNVSRHLELGASYQFTRLRFPVRDEEVDIQLLRLRIRTALDARASCNAFVQYNSTTDRVDFNVRFRYNVREGTDLWVVYNEALDTERDVLAGEMREPSMLARAVVVKYTHTLTF